ncbi:PD-(D/E)XK nuclease-like domain-containing protein [Nocardiopsis tropica]|uniref:PD-(D/E)XK nuclease-like domain-containing protein n=1 Tax=Nocardiopsis tropica TaxID=109330 RepID=A0ABU7KSX3_9ACTN|nr:PD-(D/E)XK nuclease-like domain-containing protein [Nocardiopsis umidischolae]MEE2051747.1 PD-(D/E)XK nuclease-like domain-containing protein [Nocardiopsis umidischolae]
MTATDERTLSAITRPGVYDGIPEAVYHRDPVPGGSLSSSGARKLLAPSCPALFRYEQDHKQPHKAVFDFGRAAHEEVLGVGGGIEVVDAADWRGGDARKARDAAYDAGKTPLLPKDYKVVKAMADALKAHPIAGALFQPGTGKAEQSLFWKDPQTGVICRARFDWLPTQVKGRRLVIGDYKTCRSAAPADLSKAIHEHGYHQQDDWYRAGARALGIGDKHTSFVFIFQQKTAPYLVTVVELDWEARRIGAERNRHALKTYARCMETGVWPGFSDDIEVLSLPAYAERQHDEEFMA